MRDQRVSAWAALQIERVRAFAFRPKTAYLGFATIQDSEFSAQPSARSRWVFSCDRDCKPEKPQSKIQRILSLSYISDMTATN